METGRASLQKVAIRQLDHAAGALAELNATAADHRNAVIWCGSWHEQDALCLDIGYSLMRAIELGA